MFCIPLKIKAVSELVQANIDELYTKLGGSITILSNNGTEFKNQLLTNVATQLGVEHRVYFPPYHPQSNERIEGFHNFLKACMSKHVSKSLEWDQVTPLSCAADTILPNEHSKESPLFLMFGRDTIVLLNSLLTPTVRYLQTNENIIFLEASKYMYQLIASNLEHAQKERATKAPLPDRKLSEGDSVLLKDSTASIWDPRYAVNY